MNVRRPQEGSGGIANPREARRKRSRGISLLELLLAVGSGGVVIFAMVTVYLVGFDSWSSSARRASAQQEASTAMEIMARKVRPASRVIVAGSPDSLALQLNTSGGAVSLGRLHLVGLDGIV